MLKLTGQSTWSWNFDWDRSFDLKHEIHIQSTVLTCERQFEDRLRQERRRFAWNNTEICSEESRQRERFTECPEKDRALKISLNPKKWFENHLNARSHRPRVESGLRRGRCRQGRDGGVHLERTSIFSIRTKLIGWTPRKVDPPFFLLELAIPWSKVATWLGRSPQSERLRDCRCSWPRRDSSLVFFYYYGGQCFPFHLTDWNLAMLTLSSLRLRKEEAGWSWQEITSSQSWCLLSLALDRSSRSRPAAALDTQGVQLVPKTSYIIKTSPESPG